VDVKHIFKCSSVIGIIISILRDSLDLAEIHLAGKQFYRKVDTAIP